MIRKLIRIAADAGMVAASIVLFAMMAMIALEVFIRNAFSMSLEITDEYSGYLVVAIFFLGAAFSLREEALLRVDFLFKKLKPRLQLGLMIVFDILALIFSGIVTYELAKFTFSAWRQGVFAPTTVMTPLYLPELVMPIGMMLVCFVLISNIASSIHALVHPADRDRPKAGSPR